MRAPVLSSLVALSAICISPCISADAHQGSWIVGFWHMTKDEDGGAIGAEVEFRADVNYVGYDKNCKTYPPTTYFLHNDDVFVVYVVPGKGPVSVIYHPNSAHSQLTFTSVRTRNNAVYERAPAHRCGSQG